MDTKKEVRYGYVCGIDFGEHMTRESEVRDPLGARVYGTLEQLKRSSTCCSRKEEDQNKQPLHCAIYKVKVTIEEVIQEGLS